MEKLKLKLRNLDYFLMKLNGSTEEKLRLLNKSKEIQVEVDNIEKERKEVNNELDKVGKVGSRDSSTNTTVPREHTKKEG